MTFLASKPTGTQTTAIVYDPDSAAGQVLDAATELSRESGILKEKVQGFLQHIRSN